jgi:predicted ATP-binding protein involved in virulence
VVVLTLTLITTHSPFMLDYFDPSCIRVTQMVNGQTTISNIRKSQIKTVKDGLMSLSEIMFLDGLKQD